MKEHPILFSAPMVRAILEGKKTQTRRIVKPKQIIYIDEHQGFREPGNAEICPYGRPGDRLWVRETWRDTLGFASDPLSFYRYRATDPLADEHKWKPSIHMPRIASRILLEITGVRVERLHEISEADAQAEGVERVVAGAGWRRYCDPDSEEVGVPPCGDACRSFRSLWEFINGADSWQSNPWVWVVEFKRIQ